MIEVELWGTIKGVWRWLYGTFGYLYAKYQRQKIDRADRVNDFITKIYHDKEICEIIYLMDYNSIKWYPDYFPRHRPQDYVPTPASRFPFTNDNIEPLVDKTLKYFSYICYLREQKIICDSEFQFFRYECNRLLTNPQLQNYLFNLYHFTNSYNLRHFGDKFKLEFPFLSLLNYAKKNNILPIEFYDPNSYIYYENYERFLFF